MGKASKVGAMEDVTNTIVSCGNLLVREAARLFKPLKLSPAQFNVLHLLHLRGDGLRPSDIAQSLVVDPASTTYLIDTMEKRGWLQRGDDPRDRRVYRIQLTKTGRELHDKAVIPYQAALQRMADLLGDPEELRGALGLLERLPAAALEATADTLESVHPVAAVRRKPMAR